MYYQLLAHLIGDYVLQSEWMAINKSKRSFPALVHVTCYTLPFLFLTTDMYALLLIWGTHFVIDRFRLAKYICEFRNHFSPFKEWRTLKIAERPAWLEFILLVIVDNTMHLVINAWILDSFV